MMYYVFYVQQTTQYSVIAALYLYTAAVTLHCTTRIINTVHHINIQYFKSYFIYPAPSIIRISINIYIYILYIYFIILVSYYRVRYDTQYIIM